MKVANLLTIRAQNHVKLSTKWVYIIHSSVMLYHHHPWHQNNDGDHHYHKNNDNDFEFEAFQKAADSISSKRYDGSIFLISNCNLTRTLLESDRDDLEECLAQRRFNFQWRSW